MIDYTLLAVGDQDDLGRPVVRCGRCGRAGAVEPLRRRTHGEVFIVHAARLVDWGAGSVTRDAVATCTYRARPGTFERIG